MEPYFCNDNVLWICTEEAKEPFTGYDEALSEHLCQFNCAQKTEAC